MRSDVTYSFFHLPILFFKKFVERDQNHAFSSLLSKAAAGRLISQKIAKNKEFTFYKLFNTSHSNAMLPAFFLLMENQFNVKIAFCNRFRLIAESILVQILVGGAVIWKLPINCIYYLPCRKKQELLAKQFLQGGTSHRV